MKILSFIILFCEIVFFAGCASVLSPEAQVVLVVSEKPNDCALLGAVESRVVDTSGAMSDGAIRKKAEDDLRIKVAKLGGDMLRILSEERSWDFSLGGYEIKMDAEAYKCEADSMESLEMLESPKSNAMELLESN